MPVKRPRILITLRSVEQHRLVKEAAVLQGMSVSGYLVDLLDRALKPLVALKRLSDGQKTAEGQRDLVEFLTALLDLPKPSGGDVAAHREPADPSSHNAGTTGEAPTRPSGAVPEASSGRASILRSARPEGASGTSPRPRATPRSNTGVGFQEPIDFIKKRSTAK